MEGCQGQTAPTSAPRNVVGLDFCQNVLGLLLAGDVLDALDEHVKRAGEPGAELLNGWRLLLLADDAGDGPCAAEQQRRELLGNVAVAAEDEDVMRGHGVCMDGWMGGLYAVGCFDWGCKMGRRCRRGRGRKEIDGQESCNIALSAPRCPNRPCSLPPPSPALR